MKSLIKSYSYLLLLAAGFFLNGCCEVFNICEEEDPQEQESLVQDEDCIDFNPNNIAVVPFTDGKYRIIEGGNHAMFLFPNQTEANKALEIIQYYELNQSCFVGRPNASFHYLLKDGESPVNSFTGEDCLPFNPNTIEVTEINGSWKIVDGDHWILDFEDKEEEASKAFDIIKAYGFTMICFVGRPDPSLLYLRK